MAEKYFSLVKQKMERNFYISISWIRDSANAGPDYQKLCARHTHIRSIRKVQLYPSAMEEPRPEGTAFVITVSSAPSKL